MKHQILICVLVIASAVGAVRAKGQGTTYISNLDRPSSGNEMVAGSFSIAQGFSTGADAAGYLLTRVDLRMGNTFSNATGFSVSIYTAQRGLFFPDEPIAQLLGPIPVSAGTYSYTASSLVLAPAANYWVVAAATSLFGYGSYSWAVSAETNYTASGGWSMRSSCVASTDGFNWTLDYNFPLMLQLTAEPVPEPSVISLAVAAAALGLLHRRGRPQQT